MGTLSKITTLGTISLLFCSAIVLADETDKNDTNSASSSKITQLPAIKVIGHEATGGGGGGEPAVISNDYIKTAPSATNTVTDLLRGKSYIQYDQTSRSGATGGEIAPPKVSINGGKHYENSFLINGVSNNNNIYPGGLPLNYATAQSGQPTGEAQTI
ncbi:MAG: hypothetical protein LBS39_03965, partial [Campylobacteraceae bacterium]|nr:hypothetical protein [Campylobacteraceae bacterium]